MREAARPGPGFARIWWLFRSNSDVDRQAADPKMGRNGPCVASTYTKPTQINSVPF